jgi:Gram-negative bacterial TonB protein C-terminal
VSRPVFFVRFMKGAMNMFTRFSGAVVLLVLFASLAVRAQSVPQSGGDFSNNPNAKKVPTGTILVKGAWSSASDSVTPVPEGGRVANNVYSNAYFSLAYSLSPDWTEKYAGPPPSDSGYYVLAQIRPADTFKGTTRGSVLLTAQDLFFTPAPAKNAMELISYTMGYLQADYQVERPPGEVSLAGHSFVRFDYGAPVAELHWRVLATQIRCHVLQFVFTSRDTKLPESLIQEVDRMKLPAEASPTGGTGGGDVPICVKDYASGENLTERVDPIFTERRFNPVPVRIVVDKEGKVRHIHFLSAFPDQAKAITDALSQWRFRPYLRNGQPVEVETGIMFGRAPRLISPERAVAVSE